MLCSLSDDTLKQLLPRTGSLPLLLATNRRLRGIALDLLRRRVVGLRMRTAGAYSLFATNHTNSGLLDFVVTVDFRACRYEPKMHGHLLRLISKRKDNALRALLLSNIGGFNRVLNGLKSLLPTLTSLDISRNCCGKNALEPLMLATSLQSLNLRNMLQHSNQSRFVHLPVALSGMKGLTRLDMSGSFIGGGPDAHQLADALPRGLRTLLASNISLHGDGAHMVISAIGDGVRVLDLSHNACMVTPLDAISRALPLLESVVSLSLDGCWLHKRATTGIAREIGRLTTLRTLSLARNDFGAMDVLLGASLSSLRGITHLYLHRCSISAATLVPLVLLELLVAIDVSSNTLVCIPFAPYLLLCSNV